MFILQCSGGARDMCNSTDTQGWVTFEQARMI